MGCSSRELKMDFKRAFLLKMFFWTKGKLAKVCSRIGSNFGYNRENVGDIEELKCWKEILSCNLGFEEPLYNLLDTKLDVTMDVMETRCNEQRMESLTGGWKKPARDFFYKV